MNAVAEKLVESMLPCPLAKASPWVMQVEGLCLDFDGQRVLDRLDFTLRSGQAVLLRYKCRSGNNTLLNVISGLIRPDAGDIRMCLKDREINATHASPELLACAGLGRLWQDIRLFPTMTVLDNVIAASPSLRRTTALASVAAWPWLRRHERVARERALYNLDLVGMADRAHSSADMLSVGQMKRVAVARLLQSEADLWLLDEPLAGLDQLSAEGLLRLLERLNKDDRRTLVIVEHQYERMAPLCDRTCFLADGRLREGAAV